MINLLPIQMETCKQPMPPYFFYRIYLTRDFVVRLHFSRMNASGRIGSYSRSDTYSMECHGKKLQLQVPNDTSTAQ